MSDGIETRADAGEKKPGKFSLPFPIRKKKEEEKPLKTTINFVGIEKKESPWKLAVPAVILVLVGTVLFARFAVIARFERLWAAEAEVSRLQSQMREGMEIIANSKELSERYYHYTWSGMTEEETGRTSRVDVADLITFIGSQCQGIRSCVLSGQVLSVNITADSLESISRIGSAIEERQIVKRCSTQTAQRDTLDMDTGAATNSVDAALTIYIRTKSEIAEAAASEAQEQAEGDAASAAEGDVTSGAQPQDDAVNDAQAMQEGTTAGGEQAQGTEVAADEGNN